MGNAPVRALAMAANLRNLPRGLLHHPDNGSRYVAREAAIRDVRGYIKFAAVSSTQTAKQRAA